MGIRSVLLAAALTLTAVLPAATSTSASTVQVDFSFAVFDGTITFDGIGDTTANSVTLTSNFWDEDTAIITIVRNSLIWRNGQLFSGVLDFNTSGVTNSSYSLNPPGFATFVCFSAIQSCESYGFQNGVGFFINSAFFSQPYAVAVPLPAGLPLLLAGLGSLAVLRKRKLGRVPV